MRSDIQRMEGSVRFEAFKRAFVGAGGHVGYVCMHAFYSTCFWQTYLEENLKCFTFASLYLSLLLG